jgi:ATP-binding protein involved in chromosome partitioning
MQELTKERHVHEGERTQQPAMHPSFLQVLARKKELKEKTAGIRHRIGVYSAKGGVGKTTVAVNLAYSLNGMGFRTGLLDADIDCPNVPFFIGMDGLISQELPLKPKEKEGVKVVSTAMFLDEKEKPIIWRGPLKTKMLTEFLQNTEWGDLDYLIIDLPPGTSDTPLSLMQMLELDGIVLVTTPQRISALNTIRSGYMAKRLNVAILGVVETMGSGIPSTGSKMVAERMGSEVLGAIKSDDAFNSMSDNGVIPVLENEGIRESFKGIAEKLAEKRANK